MGFKIKELPYELKVGRDLTAVSSLAQAVKEQQDQFDFVLVDACHALNFRSEVSLQTRDIALTRAGRYPSLTIQTRASRAISGLTSS